MHLFIHAHCILQFVSGSTPPFDVTTDPKYLKVCLLMSCPSVTFLLIKYSLSTVSKYQYAVLSYILDYSPHRGQMLR